MGRRSNGEGTIRQRPDGRWEGYFTTEKDANGKVVHRKFVSAKTKKECQAKLEQALREFQSEQNILSKCKYLTNSNPTIEEWYNVWLDAFIKVSARESTSEGYECFFNTYILPRVGNIKLKDLTTVTCQQLLADLYSDGRVRYRETRGPGLAARTVKDIKIALHACLQTATDEGLIPRNPCSKVQLPGESKDKKKKKHDTIKAEQLKAFLTEARDSGWYEFYFLELSTGLRVGEMTGLRWSDLNFITKELNVVRQIRRVKGKLIEEEPKTDASIRTIILGDECIRQLMLLKSRSRDENDIMFPSPVSNSYRDPNAITRRLHAIQRRAGVPNIRFHDLRHSFATLSYEQGQDIKTISNILGHTDAAFTMNTYMHESDKKQEIVTTAMETLMEKSQKQSNIIQFSA